MNMRLEWHLFERRQGAPATSSPHLKWPFGRPRPEQQRGARAAKLAPAGSPSELAALPAALGRFPLEPGEKYHCQLAAGSACGSAGGAAPLH